MGTCRAPPSARVADTIRSHNKRDRPCDAESAPQRSVCSSPPPPSSRHRAMIMPEPAVPPKPPPGADRIRDKGVTTQRTSPERHRAPCGSGSYPRQGRSNSAHQPRAAPSPCGSGSHPRHGRSKLAQRIAHPARTPPAAIAARQSSIGRALPRSVTPRSRIRSAPTQSNAARSSAPSTIPCGSGSHPRHGRSKLAQRIAHPARTPPAAIAARKSSIGRASPRSTTPRSRIRSASARSASRRARAPRAGPCCACAAILPPLH